MLTVYYYIRHSTEFITKQRRGPCRGPRRGPRLCLASTHRLAQLALTLALAVARVSPVLDAVSLKALAHVVADGMSAGMLTRANFSERTLHRMVQKYYDGELLFSRHDSFERGSQTWPRLQVLPVTRITKAQVLLVTEGY